MKIYYVGKLYHNKNKDYSNFEFKSEINEFYTSQLRISALNSNSKDFNYLRNEIDKFRATNEPISDKHIIEILNKSSLFSSRTYMFSGVIFEIIENEDGTKYGKEMLTGLLFPLELNPETKYYYGYNGGWNLVMKKTYRDNNIARFRYILSIDEVASLNEIENYKSKVDKIKREFIRSITSYYKENVFRTQIIEKEVEPLKEQNILTKLMEEIEYLLQLLKQYNTNTYNKLSLEYKKLLNDNNDSLVATDPSKKELENFLANVKLSLLVNENNNANLSEYLTDATIKYFNRLSSNELSNQDLNINDIDILTEMFLTNKDDYTVIEQRNILAKFSMLYLLITKANINNINIEDLKESYFSKNLKTIMVCVFILHENGIISTPVNITSSDNVTVESVIETIKQIQFNKIEKDKIKNFIK